MKSTYSSPIWPYLAILSCLFAVCVLAPRGWQRLARRESIDVFLEANGPQLSRHLRPATLAQSPAKPSPQPAAAAIERLATSGSPAPPSGQVVAATNTPASLAADGEVGNSAGAIQSAESMGRAILSNRTVRPVSEAGGKSYQSLFKTAATRTVPGSRAAEGMDQAEIGQRLPTIVAQSPAVPKPSSDLASLPQTNSKMPAAPRDARADRGFDSIRLPRPDLLMTELTALAAEPGCGAWAATAGRLLSEVCGEPATPPRPTSVVLAELRHHSQAGEALAGSTQDVRMESQMLRAQYALARRLDIWERVVSLSAKAPPDAEAAAQRMPLALEAVESLTRAQQEGTAWRDYLLLPRLRHLVGRDSNASPDERRKIARHALARLSNLRMSREQRRFIDEKAVADFRAELQHWAAEPVDNQELLVDLERYERTGSALDAQRLASNCRSLCWSADPASQQLGARIEEHYRNANVRLAVSQAFLSRFLPQPEAIVAPVRDTIAGAQVEGRSTTYTKLALLMIPDRNRLRLGIEAHGTVQSNTAATSGPATFYNSGESQFIARKLLLSRTARTVDLSGHVRSGKHAAEASLDGNRFRSRAALERGRAKHCPLRARRNAGHRPCRSRTKDSRSGAQTSSTLKSSPSCCRPCRNSTSEFATRSSNWGWSRRRSGASTSEDRAVMRFRLAGQEQLAAYTPRPRAPSDSLVSLQVHQSALNNALERLELDGRTFQLPELFEHLAEKMGRREGRSAGRPAQERHASHLPRTMRCG